MEIETLLETIKKKRWTFDVSRKFAWFVEDIQGQFANPEVNNLYKKWFGFSYRLIDYLIINGDEFYSKDDKEIVKLYHYYDASFSQDSEFLNKLINKHLLLCEYLNKNLKNFETKNFIRYSNSQLSKELKLFVKMYTLSFLPAWIRPDEYLEQSTLKLLSKEIKPNANEARKLLSSLSTATSNRLKELSYTEEPIDLLLIAQQIQKGSHSLGKLPTEIDHQITKHVSNYGWLLSPEGMKLSSFSKEDYIKRIGFLLKNDISKKIENIYNKRKEDDELFQDFVNKYKPTQRLKNLVMAIREFVFLRTYTTEISQKLFYLGRISILREIGNRIGIKNNDIVMLTFSEIEKIIQDKKISYLNLIKKRKEGYILIILNSESYTYFGKQAVFLRKKLNRILFITEKKNEIIKEIKGTSASSGKVRGKVKVVLTQRDISGVEKGDILVATMTTPEYTVAMTRAAAFITDEGGITCHAAIVAREFGVPCVVGTINATKILKDGNLVEVDANNGIVKILK